MEKGYEVWKMECLGVSTGRYTENNCKQISKV